MDVEFSGLDDIQKHVLQNIKLELCETKTLPAVRSTDVKMRLYLFLHRTGCQENAFQIITVAFSPKPKILC